MHLLVSNDDGYLAPGLLALVKALKPLGKITVIAPEQNHSGASNSLTLSRPLSVHRVAGGERDGFLFVNGTPTDCVHIALTGFLQEMPDLVISGINQGENMGEDVLYSGTVAAAIEGVMFGIPAIAGLYSKTTFLFSVISSFIFNFFNFKVFKSNESIEGILCERSSC